MKRSRLRRKTPLKSKTPIKRTGFKRKSPNKNRAKHKNERDKYRDENPVCFWDGCNQPATQTDHIKPKSGDSYEHPYVWFPICKAHHDLKGTNNKKYVLLQIEMQVRRGMWFETAEEEFEFFGKCYYFDARDI